MKKSKLIATILLTTTLVISGCATIDPVTGERKDPLEGFNRAMWSFNYDYADPYLLKPVAEGWNDYVPKPAKTILTNVANNLDEPAAFVNRLLEGEFKKAMVHFNRFWINTVFGVGGMMDIASASEPLNIHEKRNFGDTLGVYGVDTGSYVVLPFYGAATPRQDIGGLADYAYPVYSIIQPWGWLKYAIQGIDSRARALDKEAILRQSRDPYATYREAYFQNLEFRINDGKTTVKPPLAPLSEQQLDEID